MYLLAFFFLFISFFNVVSLTSESTNGLSYKDLFEKEKVLTDHLKTKNELMREQYRKVNTDFRRLIHKHERLFEYFDDEISLLKGKVANLNVRRTQKEFFFIFSPLLIISIVVVVLLLCLLCGRPQPDQTN
ncbi:hypothetical protein PFISCL1PPCAC_1385 [Pristionchus fissidentatus]|uniref:Uncharacterized protein n=1 Tax=Pristionchus fissidentatus TaxID=1538716 RepID=A0AAV5UV64_9BILA|nr:hypothetical protein PFISCL1PPCAC_1385 [Pristionchus fissidentatus]